MRPFRIIAGVGAAIAVASAAAVRFEGENVITIDGKSVELPNMPRGEYIPIFAPESRAVYPQLFNLHPSLESEGLTYPARNQT